jgi:hypothetical protein
MDGREQRAGNPGESWGILTNSARPNKTQHWHLRLFSSVPSCMSRRFSRRPWKDWGAIFFPLTGLLTRLRGLELSLERCLMHRFLVQQQLRRLKVRIGVEPILHNVVVKQVEHG